jgi:hypothetical protein
MRVGVVHAAGNILASGIYGASLRLDDCIARPGP